VDLSRPLTDRHKICTLVWCGGRAENLLSKICIPTSKKFGGETSNLSHAIEDRRQSEARNFDTAQNIDN